MRSLAGSPFTHVSLFRLFIVIATSNTRAFSPLRYLVLFTEKKFEARGLM
jgi:hypothetical protein